MSENLSKYDSLRGIIKCLVAIDYSYKSAEMIEQIVCICHKFRRYKTLIAELYCKMELTTILKYYVINR